MQARHAHQELHVFTHRKRVFVIVCLVAGIGFSFGYFSRYPDLHRKAMAAESATVGDTISMWPVLKIHAYDPTWQKIAYTTVNWCNDNKKGMAFGIVIAALLSVLMSYVRFRPSLSVLRNTFYGFVIGTPLGVCVNCAAPVFKGVLRSRRIEMALALMFASPTLNVVVVTMAFTLLPMYMAATKLIFNLLVIFALVPLLAKRLARWPVTDITRLERALPGPESSLPAPTSETWPEAIVGLLQDGFRRLGALALRTVPLMLVAGFLGAVVSHLVPLDLLRGTTGGAAVGFAAVVGLVLPVPMAFDVVLTHALYSAGLPSAMAMVLLLSLGVFSLYSFLIVWQSASRAWATTISACLLCVIVPIGLAAPRLHEAFYLAPNRAAYQELSAHARPNDAPAPAVAQRAAAVAPAWPAGQAIRSGRLTATPHAFAADPAQATGRFQFHEGPQLGLDRGFVYTVRDYPDPFWIGRGTAAGDYDQDGWPDLAFGSDHGVVVYHNIGGRFERAYGPAADLAAQRVFAVAMVDLNNDGWLDLFISTFLSGNYYVLNVAGQFEHHSHPIPNGGGVLTVSPAFADLDRDGYLDIFNGNMVLGVATGMRAYGAGRRNGFTFNHNLSFTYQALDEDDGETMASLLSDLDSDGYVDLYQSNDFIVPDRLSFGRPGGRWLQLPPAALRGFATPFYSMSADSGDIDNDQRLDLLVTGSIAGRQDLGDVTIDGVKPAEYKQAKASEAYCDRIHDPFYRQNCHRNRKTNHLIAFERLKNLNVRDCQRLDDDQRDDCLLSMMWMIVTSNDDDSDCQTRYGFDPAVLSVCKLMRAAGPYHAATRFDQEAPQIDRAVLYRGTADGGLARVDKPAFDHPGGWTWSSKFFDADNDGWQDIFNAEGAVREGEWGFNVFLHNEGGGRFVQNQFSFGLANDFNLFSFALVDYDRDGDLDIIGNSSEGPIQIYENRSTHGNHSVAFRLRLPTGNRLGINARILITDDQGRNQVREIKAGGGYLSFDAPEAYFGLGSATAVESLTLVTPDGERITERVHLPAGSLYELELAAAPR